MMLGANKYEVVKEISSIRKEVKQILEENYGVKEP
jgi:hypothetical protein